MRFFKFQRAVDLDQLAADGHFPFSGSVFDELLRNGRATGFTLSEEHFKASTHRCDPVYALVLFKALVFNSNAGVNEVFGNIVIFNECAVRAAVDGLQDLAFSGIRIFIVHN